MYRKSGRIKVDEKRRGEEMREEERRGEEKSNKEVYCQTMNKYCTAKENEMNSNQKIQNIRRKRFMMRVKEWGSKTIVLCILRVFLICPDKLV